jgi:hypothetical protein
MTESDRPIAELMREFSQQTTTLIRQELELGRLELTEKGKRAGLGAGLFGGAGALGFYALGALTACFVLALATAMNGWLAALIVAAAYGAAAGALALFGRSKVSQAVPPIPEQATTSVKEDVQWTTSKAKQARN